MKRRNFIKGMFGVIVAAVVPIKIVEANKGKEYPNAIRWQSTGEDSLVIGTQEGLHFIQQSEQDKAFHDMMLYGTGVIKDGKRVPPSDVALLSPQYLNEFTRVFKRNH